MAAFMVKKPAVGCRSTFGARTSRRARPKAGRTPGTPTMAAPALRRATVIRRAWPTIRMKPVNGERKTPLGRAPSMRVTDGSAAKHFGLLHFGLFPVQRRPADTSRAGRGPYWSGALVEPRRRIRCVRIFVTFVTIFVTFVTVRTAPSATRTRPIGRRAWRQVAGTRWTEVAPAKQRDRRTWLSFASFHLQCPLRDTIDRWGRVSPVFSSHALGNDGLLRDIRQMFTRRRVPREHQSCLQVFMCRIWQCSAQPKRLQVQRGTHALEDSTRQRHPRRPVQPQRQRHQVIPIPYRMPRQHPVTPI